MQELHSSESSSFALLINYTAILMPRWTMWLPKLELTTSSSPTSRKSSTVYCKFRWKLNPPKCVFNIPSGKLLGFIVCH